MRINRQNSSLSFRQAPRRSGCLSFYVLIALMLGITLISRDWIAQWLTRPPDLPSLAGAQAAFSQGDLTSTISITRQLLDADTQNADALTLLIRALIYRSYVDYSYRQDAVQALSLTQAAHSREPRNPQVLASHAFALQTNGQPIDASRYALRAIERDPSNVPARLALALAYGSQGVFEAALREARYAVALADGAKADWRADARRVLAITYSDLGRYDDALATIREAISLHRRLIPLHFELALYATQISDDDSATAAWFQVVALDEDNAKARLRLCDLSSRLREPLAAESYCRQAVDLAPTWSAAWYQLGWEYFLQGNLRAAQEALNRCSTLQVLQNVPIPERRFECWYVQGQAAEILGDCEVLVPLYNEFREMAAATYIPQTWAYPPEGPPGCAGNQPQNPAVNRTLQLDSLRAVSYNTFSK
jgi:tetratricopeptide (TPR) repeat protein